MLLRHQPGHQVAVSGLNSAHDVIAVVAEQPSVFEGGDDRMDTLISILVGSLEAGVPLPLVFLIFIATQQRYGVAEDVAVLFGIDS